MTLHKLKKIIFNIIKAKVCYHYLRLLLGKEHRVANSLCLRMLQMPLNLLISKKSRYPKKITAHLICLMIDNNLKFIKCSVIRDLIDIRGVIMIIPVPKQKLVPYLMWNKVELK